jgi:hypothetical protein
MPPRRPVDATHLDARSVRACQLSWQFVQVGERVGLSSSANYRKLVKLARNALALRLNTRRVAIMKNERLVTLGVDPGDVWTGYAVLAFSDETSPPSVLDAGIVAPEFASEIITAIALRCGVSRAAVERAANVFPGGHRSAVVARGGALARANWVGGEIVGRLRGAGLAVETPTSNTWRLALVGASSPTPGQVHAAVRAACPSWLDPALPSEAQDVDREHARDGAGLALYAYRWTHAAVDRSGAVAA